MSRWVRPGQAAEWEELFLDFHSSAYRLQVHQTYSSDVEDAAVQRFLAGEPHGIDLTWFTSKLEQQRLDGRSTTLVNVVVEPPNDYTRMSIAILLEYVAAGQDTRIIPVAENKWPEDLPRYDYWLFDETDVWRMHYDEGMRWVGAELLDRSATPDHVRWRDHALELSTPLDDYLDEPVRAGGPGKG
jgi:hypothetical protein